MDKKGLKDILIYIQKEINETNNVLVNIEQLKLVILCFKKYNVELNEDNVKEIIQNSPKIQKVIHRVMSQNNLQELIEKEESISILAICYDSLQEDIQELKLENQENDDTNNPLAIYLNDIKKYPLLTKDEEQRLGKLVAEHNAEAAQALYNSNLRLVVSMAKKYTNAGIDIMDLIQEGNIGLLIAIQKFDYSKGFKFSSYAIHWIKQSILRAIGNDSRTIRIPIYIQEKARKIKQLKDENYKESEIAELLNLPIERVVELDNALSNIFSLDTPIGDGDLTIQEVMKDENISLEDEAEYEDLKDVIYEIINSPQFNKREKQIIKMRYGFDGKIHSLSEIGTEFSITKQRASQIEINIKRKLEKLLNKYIAKGRLVR